MPSTAVPTGRRADLVRVIADGHAEEPGALLPVLHAVQDELGHLTRDDLIVVADVLNLSVADVHGVVSFYEDFRTTPAPAHTVRVCRGEACQSLGAERLFEPELVRSVSAAGDVEHDQVLCLGNCALGPSVQLDGRLHGRVTPDRLLAMVAELPR